MYSKSVQEKAVRMCKLVRCTGCALRNKKIKFQYNYSKTFKSGTQEFDCYSQAKKYK